MWYIITEAIQKPTQKLPKNNQSLKLKNSSFPSHGYHHYSLEYVGPEKESSAILVIPKCQRTAQWKVAERSCVWKFLQTHTITES